MKYGPYRNGYTQFSCNQWCFIAGYKYFALQNSGMCLCDDTFSTPPSVYQKVPDSKCNVQGEMRGGAWINAVYGVVMPGTLSTKCESS